MTRKRILLAVGALAVVLSAWRAPDTLPQGGATAVLKAWREVHTAQDTGLVRTVTTHPER